MNIREYTEGKLEMFQEQLEEFVLAFEAEFGTAELDLETYEDMFYAFATEEEEEEIGEGSVAEEVAVETAAPVVNTIPATTPVVEGGDRFVSSDTRDATPRETATPTGVASLQVDPAEAERIKAALATPPAAEAPVELKPHEKKALEKIRKKKEAEEKKAAEATQK